MIIRKSEIVNDNERNTDELQKQLWDFASDFIRNKITKELGKNNSSFGYLDSSTIMGKGEIYKKMVELFGDTYVSFKKEIYTNAFSNLKRELEDAGWAFRLYIADELDGGPCFYISVSVY